MSCEENYPSETDKPTLESSFPLKSTSGHVTELVVKIRHFKGETVLPGGLTWNPDSAEYKSLTDAQFEVPHKSSQVKPSTSVTEKPDADGRIETVVTLPLLPLPKKPGPAELTLPPLPIAISRASGQLGQLCTSPHVLSVEDPTANVPNAELRPDPEPLVQRETWTQARDIATILLIAIPAALALGFLFSRLLPKLKKTPPPPPPIPPWRRALDQLSTLESERLLEAGRGAEYIDRVSDTLREYLGSRYGFDGLESTTREVLRQMTEKAPDFRFETEVRAILQRSDLAKFARRVPEQAECKDALFETRRIVERTTPAPTLDPRTAESQGGPAK
jgi:hypothetical protein